MLVKVGYVYCFSNVSMPGILKCGMTMRTPPERLKEANHSDTWRPPTPFCIEFAKKVNNPIDKERYIHSQLLRIHPRREFFKSTIDNVRKIFDSINGEMWVDTQHKTTALHVRHVPYYIQKSKRAYTYVDSKTIAKIPTIPTVTNELNKTSITTVCDRCDFHSHSSTDLKEHLYMYPPCIDKQKCNKTQQQLRDTYFSKYFNAPPEFDCTMFAYNDCDEYKYI